METLLRFDTELFLFFNSLHATWADRMVYFISQTWFWIPLFMVVIFLIFRQYRKQAWKVLLVFALTITLTDQTCNLIKHSVCRFRPSHTEAIAGQIHLVQKPDGQLYYGGKYGFPSAHAANTMALAFLVIFFLSKGKKWVIMSMILWSMLMAYTRLYLGVHYPLDILCGFVLGCCYAFLMIFICRKWLAKESFGKE